MNRQDNSFFQFNTDWVLEDRFKDQIKLGLMEEDAPLPEKLEKLRKHLRN